MNDNNKDLLNRLAENRLKESMTYETNSDESNQATKEAMDAVKQLIELEKLEFEKAKEDQGIKERKAKEEQSLKEQKENRVVEIIEKAAIPVLLVAIDIGAKIYFLRKISDFEKDYTWTTSAGKSTSSWFRFKK